MTAGPLSGRRIVTTRAVPGALDRMLAAAGAEVVHVPVTVTESLGVDLAAEITRRPDWLAVTSPNGASAVAEFVRHADPGLRLAAVGRATAERLSSLSGRDVDVVPGVQTGAALAAALPPDPGVVLVAQGDPAQGDLVAGLRDRGVEVDVVTVYRTLPRTPPAAELAAAAAADLVTLASGSAARAWAARGETSVPVAVIGPTTAAAAAQTGLQIAAVAADHSLDGLVEIAVEVCASLPLHSDRRPASRPSREE